MFPWEPTAWLEKGKEMKKRSTILKPASASILCTGGSLAGTFSRPWLFIDFFLRLLFRICKTDELWLCTAVPDAAAGASILGGGESMTANTRLLHSRTHVPWLWWSSIHMKGLCMCVCVCVYWCIRFLFARFLSLWKKVSLRSLQNFEVIRVCGRGVYERSECVCVFLFFLE